MRRSSDPWAFAAAVILYECRSVAYWHPRSRELDHCGDRHAPEHSPILVKHKRRRNEEGHQPRKEYRADSESFRSKRIGQIPPATNAEQSGKVNDISPQRRM